MQSLRNTLGWTTSTAALAAALTLGTVIGAMPVRAEVDALVDGVADTVSVPLHIEGDGFGQPVVEVSIGGADPISVALDTGSRGLVVSMWDLPWQDIRNALGHFSFDDINIGAFPAGFTIGLDVPTSVDFGGGAIAEHTVVNGLLLSFPFSAIDVQAQAGAPVDGILGIGPNAGGSYLVTADLPGELGRGVLIDEPGGRLVFGAQPDTVDGLSPIATLQGAPYPGGPHSLDDIGIQFHGGPLHTVGGVFDTGGKGGWIPSDLYIASILEGHPPPPADQLPVERALFDFVAQLELVPMQGGVPISVYAPGGELLYSFVTSDSTVGAMQILPNWLMKMLVNLEGMVNTGNAAFLHNPVYISNADGGAMTFYGPATGSGGGTVEP